MLSFLLPYCKSLFFPTAIKFVVFQLEAFFYGKHLTFAEFSTSEYTVTCNDVALICAMIFLQHDEFAGLMTRKTWKNSHLQKKRWLTVYNLITSISEHSKMDWKVLKLCLTQILITSCKSSWLNNNNSLCWWYALQQGLPASRATRCQLQCVLCLYG